MCTSFLAKNENDIDEQYYCCEIDDFAEAHISKSCKIVRTADFTHEAGG